MQHTNDAGQLRYFFLTPFFFSFLTLVDRRLLSLFIVRTPLQLFMNEV
jgi:hypothetical protein